MSQFCPLKQHRAKECMVLGYAEGGLAGCAEGKWAPDHAAFSTLTGGNECCCRHYRHQRGEDFTVLVYLKKTLFFSSV